MENARTTSARDHDDHETIDAAVAEADTGVVAGTRGGNLAADVATQDELREVEDPDARTRATKQDDIDNNVAYDSDRRGANKR